MNRIVYMVLKNIFHIPSWFYKLCMLGREKDTHTESERYDFLRMVVKKVNKSGHVTIDVHGVENLPVENGFVLFPNHQGLFDVLAMIEANPYSFGVVVKKEVANIILIKQVLRLIRGFSIDREDIRSSFKLMNQISEEVKGGRNFLIFAEGTRSKNGNRILDFKGGTFKSAVNAKCPIVPVALIDSFKPFDIASIKSEVVQVHFLKPLLHEQYTGMKTTEIAHLVHDQIQEKIDEFI